MRATPRRPTKFALGLVAATGVGLAIRLVYALVVMGGRPVTGDGREFHYLAIVLARAHRYLEPFLYLFRHGMAIPTAEKPPLYPLLLSLPASVGLDSYAAQRVVSCLLGAAAVAVIGLVGRRVGGAATGVVAAAIAAVYPALWMLDSSLRSESLYVLLIALVVLAAYRTLDVPSARRGALLGALVGLAALTRSEALLLLLLLALPLVLALPRGRRLRVALALLGGCALLVSPWLVRNWTTFDRPTALSTNEGGLLAGANCHAAYYTPLIGAWACFPVDDPAWGTNEAVISNHLQSRALRYARRHAGRVPAVVGVRILRVWDLWSPRRAAVFEAQIADRDLHAQQAAVAALYLLAALALAGAVTLRRRGRPLRILLALPVFVTVVAATSYGSTRFRVAAEVTIVVLASVALSAALERRAARAERVRSVA